VVLLVPEDVLEKDTWATEPLGTQLIVLKPALHDIVKQFTVIVWQILALHEGTVLNMKRQTV
jgi:hypothetical protein